MLKKAPKNFLKSVMKKKAHIRIGTNADLMLIGQVGEMGYVTMRLEDLAGWLLRLLQPEGHVQLSVLLFLRCLAEETRAKAFEEKMATIKARHIKAVSKKLLKKARG